MFVPLKIRLEFEKKCERYSNYCYKINFQVCMYVCLKFVSLTNMKSPNFTQICGTLYKISILFSLLPLKGFLVIIHFWNFLPSLILFFRGNIWETFWRKESFGIPSSKECLVMLPKCWCRILILTRIVFLFSIRTEFYNLCGAFKTNLDNYHYHFV